MTNTSCENILGVQFCESDKKSNFFGIVFLGVVLFVTAAIVTNLANDLVVSVSDMLNGLNYIGY